MNTLRQLIDDNIKSAMRTRDKERLAVLRLIAATLKQQEIDHKLVLEDPEIISIINKMARQARDSIKQFEQAGRQDLVEKESFGLAVMQDFLPTPLTDTELRQTIDQTIAKSGAKSKSDMGKVMKLLKPLVHGRADMKMVSSLVRNQLSG